MSLYAASSAIFSFMASDVSFMSNFLSAFSGFAASFKKSATLRSLFFTSYTPLSLSSWDIMSFKASNFSFSIFIFLLSELSRVLILVRYFCMTSRFFDIFSDVSWIFTLPFFDILSFMRLKSAMLTVRS